MQTQICYSCVVDFLYIFYTVTCACACDRANIFYSYYHFYSGLKYIDSVLTAQYFTMRFWVYCSSYVHFLSPFISNSNSRTKITAKQKKMKTTHSFIYNKNKIGNDP